MSVDELLDKALKLPFEDRELVLQEILESLHDDELSNDEREELKRRVEEVNAGRVKGIPIAQTLARARAAMAEVEHARKGTTSACR
jgi:putative addiction module component (TIGR02574 family)